MRARRCTSARENRAARAPGAAQLVCRTCTRGRWCRRRGRTICPWAGRAMARAASGAERPAGTPGKIGSSRARVRLSATGLARDRRSEPLPRAAAATFARSSVSFFRTTDARFRALEKDSIARRWYIRRLLSVQKELFERLRFPSVRACDFASLRAKHCVASLDFPQRKDESLLRMGRVANFVVSRDLAMY